MPIRFACEHCGQRLNVASSKAGVRAKCPKCKQSITVPSKEASAKAASGREEPPAAQGEADPFSQFVVYDDAEWVYQSDDPELDEAARKLGVDRSKVAVPRSVLYMQGALLGALAVGCFALGVFVGGGSPPEDSDFGLPTPCFVTGAVRYAHAAKGDVPDEGAVAIVLPQDIRPEEQAPPEGLRPGDPPPDKQNRGLQTIKQIGGDYARADARGQFELRVPDVGHYYILVISRNVKRKKNEPLNKTDLAQMGRYFLPVLDLLGESQYQWRAEQIRRDRKLDIIFD